MHEHFEIWEKGSLPICPSFPQRAQKRSNRTPIHNLPTESKLSSSARWFSAQQLVKSSWRLWNNAWNITYSTCHKVDIRVGYVISRVMSVFRQGIRLNLLVQQYNLYFIKFSLSTQHSVPNWVEKILSILKANNHMMWWYHLWMLAHSLGTWHRREKKPDTSHRIIHVDVGSYPLGVTGDKHIWQGEASRWRWWHSESPLGIQPHDVFSKSTDLDFHPVMIPDWFLSLHKPTIINP